ncbi:DUF3310 domain-containing protein [Nocardia rhizosphaerihabitans]|uniref:DUF3310 domain-containing protein n=1 Tax=Nocardia rhizosphaerihabitans TaxID=1691570 RepID=UPI00366D6323
MPDPINPDHYQRGEAQLIDLIEHLPGNRFNAAKYQVRAGEKNPLTLVEDLEKSLWYQLREFYRLGVITFNPAAPGAKAALREFLVWNPDPEPHSPALALVSPLREPRVWDRFIDVPEGVEVMSVRDIDRYKRVGNSAFVLDGDGDWVNSMYRPEELDKYRTPFTEVLSA